MRVDLSKGMALPVTSKPMSNDSTLPDLGLLTVFIPPETTNTALSLFLRSDGSIMISWTFAVTL